MFRRMAEDHFILYLMLMAILGFTLGFLGILAICVILAWTQIASFLYTISHIPGVT